MVVLEPSEKKPSHKSPKTLNFFFKVSREKAMSNWNWNWGSLATGSIAAVGVTCSIVTGWNMWKCYETIQFLKKPVVDITQQTQAFDGTVEVHLENGWTQAQPNIKYDSFPITKEEKERDEQRYSWTLIPNISPPVARQETKRAQVQLQSSSSAPMSTSATKEEEDSTCYPIFTAGPAQVKSVCEEVPSQWSPFHVLNLYKDKQSEFGRWVRLVPQSTKLYLRGIFKPSTPDTWNFSPGSIDVKELTIKSNETLQKEENERMQSLLNQWLWAAGLCSVSLGIAIFTPFSSR
jgi:hypothetical protein